MAQRLMTPLCFASILAAALIAEGSLAGADLKAAPARVAAPFTPGVGSPAKHSASPKTGAIRAPSP